MQVGCRSQSALLCFRPAGSGAKSEGSLRIWGLTIWFFHHTYRKRNNSFIFLNISGYAHRPDARPCVFIHLSGCLRGPILSALFSYTHPDAPTYLGAPLFFNPAAVSRCFAFNGESPGPEAEICTNFICFLQLIRMLPNLRTVRKLPAGWGARFGTDGRISFASVAGWRIAV